MWGQARPTLLTALGSSRQGLAGMAPPAKQQHTFSTLEQAVESQPGQSSVRHLELCETVISPGSKSRIQWVTHCQCQAD